MNINFEEKNGKTLFKVKDFEPGLGEVLHKTFYEKDGDSYFKAFPNDYRYLDKVKPFYQNNLEKMLLQQGYFDPIPWETGLEKFTQKANEAGIDWWLTGSCAACIRGVPLSPHDIDIMVNEKDFEETADVFSDYIIEPLVDTEGWVIKYMGVLFMDVAIDIASGPDEILDKPGYADCGPFAEKHLEQVEWEGYTIKVPPLELQLETNRRRKRFERVRLIDKHMKNQSK